MSRLSITATTLVVTYLSHVAFQPPNPKLSNPTEDEDKWDSPFLEFIEALIKYGQPALGVFHAYLALTYPYTPSRVCPNGQNSLNADLFTWMTQSTFLLTAMGFFAVLRLVSYRALGPDFVYQLTKPSYLRTTGIYAWVQHPGYTTVIGTWVANISLLLRPDGALGCFLPGWIASWGNCFAAIQGIAWLMWLSSVIPPRVADEEKMLRREFGKDWEKWASKTARFIPGIY